MEEMWKTAREMLSGRCLVCPVCNGARCPSGVPGMGGAGTGASFRANITALTRRRLKMRLIHNAARPDTAVSLLGLDLSMPVLAAPVAGVPFNMTEAMSEQEYIERVFAGCARAGIAAGCGDGAPDDIWQANLAAAAKTPGVAVPFIKPWADDIVLERFGRYAAAGAVVGGMDIDAAGLVTLSRMGKPVGPKTVDEHRRLKEASPLKVLLKGVMAVEDALAAVDAGVDGIVVSNHGGRVLDSLPGTAEVLPSITRAVDGRLTVLADGGVRSGSDVLKMLALGADAVLIGRPLAQAALGGGADGVHAYLEKIRVELVQAMILTGCASVADIGPWILADSL